MAEAKARDQRDLAREAWWHIGWHIGGGNWASWWENVGVLGWDDDDDDDFKYLFDQDILMGNKRGEEKEWTRE